MILSDHPLLRRWFVRTAIVLGLVLTLALGMLWAATGPLGRWTVLHFADARELPRGLMLEIDGLSGNVLQRPTVERLTLSDADGVFLVIENISVNWDGLALLGGNIEIDDVAIGEIDLARMPALEPSSGGSGDLPSIRVDAISVNRFALDEDVVGEAADFSIRGEGRMQSSGRLSFEVLRTDILGDRISSEVIWSDAGDISGSASAFLSGSGPVASLLKLDGRDAELSGQVSGTSGQGTGAVNITLAGQDAASAGFDWQNGRWTSRIDVDGSVLEAIRGLAIDLQARIEVEGALSPLRPDMVSAEGQGWRLDVTPDGPQRFAANVVISQPVWRALAGDSINIDQTRWAGTIDYAAGITADGVLQLETINAGETSIEELGGSLLFTRSDGQNSVFADLTATQITLPGNTPIATLPWIGLAVEARQEGQVYIFEALNLTSNSANIAGHVQLDPNNWVLNGDARLTLLDISALTEMATGTAIADLRIQTLSREGVALEIDLEGGDVGWVNETLSTLLTQASSSARLESDFANWRVDGLVLNSTSAAIRGAASGEGANWSATLDAAVNTDLAFGDTVIGGGAAIALQMQGAGLSAAGEAVVSTPRLDVGGRSLSEPRLGLDFTYASEQQAADWQLETNSDFGPLQATGTMTRDADGIELGINQGQLGAYGFTGEASLNDAGYSAGLAGRDWVLPNGELTRLDVTASNRTGTTLITTEANGDFGDPFNLVAETTLTENTISTSLTAEWASIPVSTTQPLIYQFGTDTSSLTGHLNTGVGQVGINWTSEDQIRLTISDLPADIVATAAALPAMEGLIDLDLGLRYSEERWTGTIEAQAHQLQVRQIRLGSPVSIGLSGRLTDNLNLALTVTGDDLSGRADLVRSGEIADLRQLTADAPLTGRVEMSGAIEPLLALALPDTRQLAGQLSADLNVSGTVFRPELQGETEFANGRYVSEELGVTIDDVNALAVWENGRLRIERFTATGPRGGALTVSGEGGLSDETWEASARAEFSNFNAVRRPDLSIIVSGHSDLSISQLGIDISGDVTLNRIDARPPEASARSFAEIDVTEINRPDGSDGRPTRRIPVTLDVQIGAADGIFVAGEAFSTEWRGDWHVTGSPTAPEVVGDAVLVYGRAFLLNRAFRMEEGLVSLSGDMSTAEIELLAQHQRDGLTVNARIAGPVASPTLTLSSQPALPEDEILARLLFDRNSGQLSPLETATIAAQLSGQNLFGIVGGLRRAAGLDRLDFAAGENGEIVVTGGQQLTDDVYLELESSGAALSSARLEWTLTPDFTLLSRLTGDTEASVALRWRTEY